MEEFPLKHSVESITPPPPPHNTIDEALPNYTLLPPPYSRLRRIRIRPDQISRTQLSRYDFWFLCVISFFAVVCLVAIIIILTFNINKMF
jgi:hypothetical protein